MCIPVDSMLWALVARVRDDGHVPTTEELRSLMRSGCPRARVREVLAREGERHPDRPFARALAALDEA